MVINNMWKNILGYEETYEISNFGEIWSKDRKCVDSMGRNRYRKAQKLNPDISPSGYYRVTLAKGGKKKQKYLHRLIAEYFIPNPLNLPFVNHKDGNKLNCSIENLEWVTAQENVVHAYKNGLIKHVKGVAHPNYGKFGAKSKRAKKILATNLVTKEQKIYYSMVETKFDGFLPSEVSRSCNHGRTHHGFTFELL